MVLLVATMRHALALWLSLAGNAERSVDGPKRGALVLLRVVMQVAPVLLVPIVVVTVMLLDALALLRVALTLLLSPVVLAVVLLQLSQGRQ